MFNIRQNVFETNSSSQHTICMTNGWTYFGRGKYTQDEILKELGYSLNSKGQLYIDNIDHLNFGYGFYVLSTFTEKLYYSIASLCGTQITEYGHRNNLEYQKENWKLINTQIHECIPYVNEILEPQNGEFDFGCVDHQSYGLLQNFLRDHNMSLKDFWITKSIIVFIDSDECYEMDSYIKHNNKGLEPHHIIELYSAHDHSYGY